MARRQVTQQAGFTYLSMIIFVTILGLVTAATLRTDGLLRRAAAEEELLEIGAAFSEALQSYAAMTPAGQPTQPPNIQELLRDTRFPGVRRHLRRVYIDPVTGRSDWGVTYANGQRGVLAIYSLAETGPLKIANFDSRFQCFDNKRHISDWKFGADGRCIAGDSTGEKP